MRRRGRFIQNLRKTRGLAIEKQRVHRIGFVDSWSVRVVLLLSPTTAVRPTVVRFIRNTDAGYVCRIVVSKIIAFLLFYNNDTAERNYLHGPVLLII